MVNRLYYGDNLEVLRAHIADASVDLVYLDPPFNSNATYSHLFRSPDGAVAQSQITAFEDTWEWGEASIAAYNDVLRSGNTDLAELLRAMRGFLKENALMAYLAMMAVRLVELHRVLKPTGSLYLHCDPTASHYLKLLLDGVFGADNYRSEIIWRRNASHNMMSRQYGPIHDVILFYSRTVKHRLNPLYTPYVKTYVANEFRYSDARGSYRVNELMGPGVRQTESGKPWRGYDPTPRNRHWAIPDSLKQLLPRGGEGLSLHEQLDAIDAIGEIQWSKNGRPKYKQRPYGGVYVQDIWAYTPGTGGVLYGTDDPIDVDVKWLDTGDESLGYPTQKPIGLLERIIAASSNPGDVVLDPFCGCGTAVHAAEKLGRQWIGIDVTVLAINLIEKRLRDAFPAIQFETIGLPADVESAMRLADERPHDFQYWITARVDGQAYQGGRKGMDRGIDGFIYFTGHDRTTERAIISVKAGRNIGPAMIRDLKGVMEREKAPMGIFICAGAPTPEMKREAAAADNYEAADGRSYPRVQIFTLQDLFDGRAPKVPLLDARAAYRRAPREAAGEQGGLDL